MSNSSNVNLSYNTITRLLLHYPGLNLTTSINDKSDLITLKDIRDISHVDNTLYEGFRFKNKLEILSFGDSIIAGGNSTSEKNSFYKNLKKIGYCLQKKPKHLKSVIRAFQRRYRPKIINGKIDKECFEIAKNLIKRGLN